MFQGFLILVIASATMAQVPFLRTCPNLETKANFEIEKYMGKWYEVERYFAFFEFGGKCVTATYSPGENGTIKIVNKQISALSGIASSIEGVGTPVGKDGEPKLSVVFPSLPVPIDAPYWVLDTDYTTYAVVWSCTNFGVFKWCEKCSTMHLRASKRWTLLILLCLKELSHVDTPIRFIIHDFSTRNTWILTREPQPPVSVLKKAYQVTDRNDISRAYFIRTDQKNCPASN